MSRAQKFEEKIRLHLEKVNAVQPSKRFYQLQTWQADRLMASHTALYQNPQFQPAMNFFKDELYSSEHFAERNRQLIRALPMMCRALPESVLRIVADAAELHSLSLEMDALLLHHLGIDQNLESLTLDQWVWAYYTSANPSDRDRQIELIESLGNALKTIVKKPMIKSLLNWARLPASLAGYQEIHEFICAGFNAFSALEDPDTFLQPVIQKERELSHCWFQNIVCQ